MAVIKVPTTFNIEVEFEIPEFYRRLIALLIDMLIQFFYFKIAGLLYRAIAPDGMPDEDMGHNLWAVTLLLWLPIMVYHVAMEITLNGQSLGKKVMGLKVVSENGGRASISQFFIRWLMRISDQWILLIIVILLLAPGYFRNLETAFLLLLVLGFLITDIILVVTSSKGQRIGDILAHTILIRTNTRTSIEETVFQEVADTYKPSFPQIMRLSDKDINAIKSILETSRKKGDYNIASTAAEKIKSHLNIQTDLSPFDFLEILLKDYNYLSVK